MPLLERPDGTRIHWEAQSQGPLVLIAHHTLWSHPGVYADLVLDLTRDHRVLLYDPRGCGQSDRRGPFNFETDTMDLLAVVEAAGEGAVAIGVGDGFNRTARAATARPDLISHVVSVVPAPAAVLPRSELKGSDVLGASESVVDMFLQMMNTEPRAAIRTLIAAINPELDERPTPRTRRPCRRIWLGGGGS